MSNGTDPKPDDPKWPPGLPGPPDPDPDPGPGPLPPPPDPPDGD